MQITLSIRSILGEFTNVKFHEKYLSKLPLTRYVKGYKSNWGCRGITKKPTKKQKNIVKSSYSQGNGSCFNSQITFIVITDLSEFPTYCKIFRNGKIIITGYRHNTMDVYDETIRILICYIRKNILKDRLADVRLLYSEDILRNYKTCFDKPIKLLKLSKYFGKQIESYVKFNVEFVCAEFSLHCDVKTLMTENPCIKKQFIHRDNLNDIVTLLKSFQTKLRTVNEAIVVKLNLCDLCKIILNRYVVDDFYMTNKSYRPEFYPGLLLKMINENNKKDVTIKIFASGKINIDGKQTYETALFYSKWLYGELNKYDVEDTEDEEDNEEN